MERVQELQRKLYLKARREKGYRFYILYDKVFLDYVLVESYKGVKENGGAPGVDGQTFKDIEEKGLEKFLTELKEALRKRTYKPQPVRRVHIPKANGKTRPLGIPTIRDRVAQMACKMVIEPLFEADFEDSSHGFRPKRSASDAIRDIKTNLHEGKTEVYDADLSKYFDTIPHDRLIRVLKLRISDNRIIDLIKLWLKTPYVEEGKMKGGKRNKVGTPQGGVISPLLSNIYLHLLDRIVNNKKSIFTQQGVKIVRYADDFVLMGKEIGEEVLKKLMSIVDRMGLKINEEKSKMVKAKKEPLHFLGFTIRYDRCLFNKGKHYWHIKPSEKSSKRLRGKISSKLKEIGHYPPQGVAKELNIIMMGWLNYYDVRGLSYTQMVRKELMWYLKGRLYRYYNRKSQRRSRLSGSQAFELLLRHGMVNPYKSSGLTPRIL